MISLSIQSGNSIKKILQVLNAVEELDVERILDEAASALFSRTIRRFRSQVKPDGTPWPQSQAARIRQKGGYTYSNGKRVTGGYTLYATGRLFKSIQVVRTGAGERSIQTDVPYAAFHNLTQRQFIGASENDVELFINIALSRLGSALDGKSN